MRDDLFSDKNFKNLNYEERIYRKNHIKNDYLKSFVIKYKETDLWIALGCSDDIKINIENIREGIKNHIIFLRKNLEKFIKQDKEFYISMLPYCIDKEKKNAPDIALMMSYASVLASVGPMAAVAGAFSQKIGEYILKNFDIKDVIIENGGDIYIKTTKKRVIGIYAGNSILTNKIGIEISPEDSPLGICTSSGTVGHSFSKGKADAVTVISKDTAIADAYATALGNMVNSAKDIENVLNYSKSQKDIIGTIIIVENKIGFIGDIKIKKLIA